MNASDFYVRYNAMAVSSIASFASIAGRMNSGCKDVYFLRSIGCNASYVEDIEKMDAMLYERQTRGQGAYLRLGTLPRLCQPEDVSAFCDKYDGWRQRPEDAPRLDVTAQNAPLGQSLSGALCKVREVFHSHTPGVSDSIEKNFMIKLLFWADRALEPLLGHWSAGVVEKFVYTGAVKKQEYLFCYLLTLLGIDVLILSPGGPIDLEPSLLGLSGVVHLGAAEDVVIPPYAPAPAPRQQETPAAAVPASGHKVDIRRPDRQQPAVPAMAAAPTAAPARAPAVSIPPRAPAVTIPPRVSVAATPSRREELAFEQLALLASSVVMIEVHDSSGQINSTGSGIMIGEAGYILTNHHVAGKGSGFSIHIEDDETVYHTSELIKTHALLDLAIIRIQRKLRPLPVYQQAAPLVRGQRVVAIGSPLGLFNSVSNGIISGFRTIDEVDMIQFTAPTSPGSSGGAVLNMYGEVIGISTAGMDRGQNLNLAVGHQSILPFIRGFTK